MLFFGVRWLKSSEQHGQVSSAGVPSTPRHQALGHAINLWALRSELVTFLIWLVVRGRKAWKSICQRASPGSFDFAHKPSVIR
jgi:hypothetical protein